MDQLIDAHVKVRPDVGDLIIERTQTFDDAEMDRLRRERDDFKWRLDGFTKVAEVPQPLAAKWLREGFDIHKAPANDIIRRLRLEEKDLFVTLGNRTL